MLLRPKRALTGLLGIVLCTAGQLHAQWFPTPTGFSVPLSAVAGVGDSTLIAVGARGTIIQRTRSHSTWTAHTSGTLNWLSDICFPTRTRGFVVGWNGTMLTTTDAGTTWRQIPLPSTASLTGISFSDSTIGVAVGLDGTVLRSTDGGATWNLLGRAPANLRGVACLDEFTTVACGLKGSIIRTTDGGSSWTLVPTNVQSTLYRIRIAQNGRGYAVGEKGTLLATDKGGMAWKKIQLDTTSDLWDVCMISGSTAVAVGAQGVILSSRMNDTTWMMHAAGTDEDLRGIAFANEQLGAAVGARGLAVTTTNAGGCVKFPFPQNLVYRFGTMPQQRNHRDAGKSYLTWKSTFVTADSACGFRRVLFDDMSSTTSEGIGYGMLLAVNFNDRPLFDDLWQYYKKFMNKRGLMEWHIGSNCEVLGWGAATDADEDVAFSLLLADRQWCSDGAINYRQEAVLLINRIWEHEVEKGTFVLKPGDGDWGGSHVLNPSYFAPAYYRAFEAATGNAGWRKVIDKCYEILRNCAHPETGLVPDWCRADGSPAQGREQNFYYYWDAARTPWRIALDYLWYGNEEARQFCEKITRFASSIGAANIGNGYYLDGKPMRTDPTSVFIGPLGVAAMAAGPGFQAFCNAAYRINVATALPLENNYYNWSIRTLTLLTQTGNFNGPIE